MFRRLMRYLGTLLIAIGIGVAGFLVYRHLTAGLPVVLRTPTALRVADGGAAPRPGGWVNSHSVTLLVGKPLSGMGADVEVRPLGQRFTDTPTASVKASTLVASTCQTCGASVPTVRVRLGDGAYHWQARLHNGQGVSRWVAYSGVIRVDTRAPTVLDLTSPTDPNPSEVYHTWAVRFAWSGRDVGSGVAGYSFQLDTDPHGQAQPRIQTVGLSTSVVVPHSGQYYFHVRAQDYAGNWGPTVTFPLRVSVSPPGVEDVSFSQYTFNPLFNPGHGGPGLRISFSVTQPAKTVRIGFYRQSDGYLTRLYVLRDVRPGQLQTVTWNGQGPLGHLVAAGQYSVYVRAIDAYGHSSLAGWRDLTLEYRRIVVSLSQQRLWAYDGNKLFLTSLVTTGNRLLPTPTGTFQILAKFHPFTFHSPWPKSSPFWYPPSLTQYAMMFQQGGYYIHDAPWRSVFGPGSNSQLGTPGNNYTGTHGCINVPGNVAQELFAWTPIGTPVIVQK